MNWIQNMNNALEYIEQNIANDITSDKVSEVALFSKFHFLRVFHILTGMTLGDYIRLRRLSLAAKDVMTSDMKIIDIAYKYGYETPEAFTKAFRKLHKITPSQARKQEKKLKAIPPISFQITVKGEKKMDYKIVKKEKFKLAGLSKHVTSKNGENFKIIPKFWQETCNKGITEKLEKSADELGLLGICYDYCHEQENFSYMIGIRGETIKDLDEYEVIDVPSCTWAIFEGVGPIPNAIQKIFQKIYSEWFPATHYQHASLPELEVYLPGDCNSEDYKFEVWIPVVENLEK